MLRSLVGMPAEMSSDTRRQLLNAVTDLFLLDESPSDAAKAHYGEIALQSLEHLPASDRASYAGQVASTQTLPHAVAMRLAGDDEADVARLVLKLSPVLTDSDLAAIAVSQSQSHLVAIAERARLSSGVTDILVARGDGQVLRTVSGNEGANFSDKGFDTLLERGGQDGEVSNALAKRSDLSPQRSQRVLQIVEQLRTASTAAHTPEGDNLARRARQQRLEVKLLIADIAAGTRKLDEVVSMLAEEDRAYHLAQVLASAADLQADPVLRVIMQADVAGIAVTCRSLDIGVEAFTDVLKLRARRLHLHFHSIDDDASDYAELDKATAERTMRFLKLKTKVA